jgi:serine protease Do
MNISSLNGAIITDLTKGGPGERDGLQIGDIIRTVDGTPVKKTSDVMVRIYRYSSDRHIFGIERSHLPMAVTVTTTYFPAQPTPPETHPQHSDFAPDEVGASKLLGLFLKPIGDDTRLHYHLDASLSGLVVSAVDPASDPGHKGLLPGDVVVRADNYATSKLDDLRQVIDGLRAEKREGVLLFVNRGGRNVPIPIDLPD